MKKSIFFILFVLNSIIIFGQNHQLADYDASSNPGQVIKEIKLPPASTKGNVYLSDDWHWGNFTMKGAATYKGLLLRYDLKHQNLEIRVDNEVKVCVLSMLIDFTFIDNSSNQSAYYTNINTIPKCFVIAHKGVVEVLVNKNVKLYKSYYLETKEANYVAAIDMGDRSNKILKKSNYYLQQSDETYKISTSLNKNKDAFGSKFNEVEKFAKDNKLKFKNETDLVEIINYYNKLLTN